MEKVQIEHEQHPPAFHNDFYTGESGKKYLEQRTGAQSEYTQSLRSTLFRDLGSESSVVLDFGCGTGGVLQRLQAKRRIGIEVSASTAEVAKAAGIFVCSDLAHIPDQSVDVAISFHAIEHVDDPLHILRELRRVLRVGGRARLVVPCEVPVSRLQRSWQPNSDRHLYTWTPLLFGNLAHRAGYSEIRSRVEPMVTRSRLVRAARILPPLGNIVRGFLGVRRNALNVILDARAA